jgi:hypothetical protein
VFGFVETSRPFPTMAVLDANNVTVCMHEKAAGTKSSQGGADVRRYERHWTPVHMDLNLSARSALRSGRLSRSGVADLSRM